MNTYTGKLVGLNFEPGGIHIGIIFLQSSNGEEQGYSIKKPEHGFGNHIFGDGRALYSTGEVLHYIEDAGPDIQVELTHEEGNEFLYNAKFLKG